MEAIQEECRKEARDKRQQKKEELKAAMKKPLDPFPESEVCEYERLRLNNINEREKAMEESGFFEDLKAYKKKIGFSK